MKVRPTKMVSIFGPPYIWDFLALKYYRKIDDILAMKLEMQTIMASLWIEYW